MVSIRALRATDREAWTSLWHGYQSFYRVSIADATTQIVWARLLDEAEPMNAALAMDGERAVGLVHHIRHRSCWSEGDYCYLQDLFVHPDARGRGAGRMLIEHVYAAAVEQRCSRVYWLTHESNAQAMHLYDQVAERTGFLQYRRALT
ncbi:MAG: GNAT family N-acetyltransferase [Steroidobacteraceae bacterium]